VTRRILLLPAAGDPDPAETARRDVELVAAWTPGVTGVAGRWEAGWEALRLAGEHPEIERLVLLGTPRLAAEVAPVAAKTLLLYGTKDERAGSRDARWWKAQLGDARIEMSPGRGHDDLLPGLWPRVLSFLAPGALR
jgi:pimeloyl-ACP methyl ester carboxylesterase